MTSSRDPTARLVAWGPPVVALVAFVLAALVAPAMPEPGGGAALARAAVGFAPAPHGGAPLWSLLARVAVLVPVGEIAYRLHLLSAAAAALAALWTARLVGEVARPAGGELDAAAAWGGIAAGGLVATGLGTLAAATTIGPVAIVVALLALGARLVAAVAAGDGAPAGLGLVVVVGLGLGGGAGVDAAFAGLAGVAVALLGVRLYRGARFPLAAPLIAALVIGALATLTVVRGGVVAREVAPAPAAAAPSFAERVRWLGELAADSAGPFGAIAAAVGLLVLWRRRRTGWVAAAVTAAGALAVWRALGPGAPALGGDGAPLVWAAAVLAGAGCAALVRSTGRFAPAAGLGVAVLCVAPAAALSVGALL